MTVGTMKTVERVVTGDSGDNEDSGESSDW